ncbi:MAG: hypothetical protein IJY91_04860 [Oscillospiraceae bacterium]|nr:hypothetical protein [Oscillospiraceae bacterium]
MTMDTGKEIWEILFQVMHQEEYAEVANNFKCAIEGLEKILPSFTPEQWKAFENYRDSLMDLNEAMMAIALEKK